MTDIGGRRIYRCTHPGTSIIQFKQILERGGDNKIIPCYLYPGIVWKYFLLKRFQVSPWVLGDHVHLEDPFFLAFQCNLGDPDVLGAHNDLAALELLKGNFKLSSFVGLKMANHQQHRKSSGFPQQRRIYLQDIIKNS